MKHQSSYTRYAGLLLAAILASGCATATAGHKFKRQHDGDSFTTTARVISSVPVWRMVRVDEPVEQCYEVAVNTPRYNDSYESATPTIAGGVLGGILGNQFGKGNGKTFMTIAGTVLGGSIGRDIGHDSRQRGRYASTRTETQCETVNHYYEEERLDGYRVTYRYQGETFHTTLPYDPGERLKLDVNLRPYD